MPFILRLFALAVLLSAAACRSFQPDIVRFDAGLNAAGLRHDTETVGQFFADDFTEVTRSRRTLTKADSLRAVADNDETDTKVFDHVVRRITDDVYIDTMRIVDTGERKDTHERYSVETRVMNVWLRRDKRWQIVAAQTSYTK